MKAVVLLSGGLDSATALAIALERGFSCHTLAFDYGQRHAVELEAAATVSRALGATEHRVCSFDMRWIGASALTSDVAVPKDRPVSDMSNGIPVTYVPARNSLFLTFALAWAESLECRDIFIGANAVDYSGYPDCRREFLSAWERMAELGTRLGSTGRVAVHAPLVTSTKADIIRQGVRLGVDYSMTHSCYDPVGRLACGRCDSCVIRSHGFRDAGIEDPTVYA